jgi:hypothetical protein
MAGELTAIETAKRGETVIRTTIERSPSGLTVQIQTHPSVEAFMRGLGDGLTQDVRASGRLWQPLGPNDPGLVAYNMTTLLGPFTSYDGSMVRMDQVGNSLLGGGGGAPSSVNLSFLRLLGTSEGNGVTFVLKGSVMSTDALANLRDKIGRAQDALYKMYLLPVNFTTMLITQELRLPLDIVRLPIEEQANETDQRPTT